jgi:hypothetical protein
MAVRGDVSELLVVLAILTLIGALVFVLSKRKQSAKAEVAATKKPTKKLVRKPRGPQQPVLDAGSAPGWGGGRWLGHGDFLFRNRMDHPFQRMPDHAGHPVGGQAPMGGMIQRA